MACCGGPTPAKPAIPEVQEVCDLVRAEVETKAGKNFAEFVAVEYSTQLVAGTNYFVKVHIGSEEYMHIRIFKPLPCNEGNPQLHSFHVGKTKTDNLGYF